MGKPLRLLNLTLGLVAALIAGALAKTWVAPTASTSGPPVSKPTHESVAVAFSRPARPPLEQFDSLLEKNPFKQPPPTPIVRPGSTPIPPPRPLPTLSGTMLVGDDWRAVVSDKGKAEIYTIGQEVGGGVITEIKEDLRSTTERVKIVEDVVEMREGQVSFMKGVFGPTLLPAVISAINLLVILGLAAHFLTGMA